MRTRGSVERFIMTKKLDNPEQLTYGYLHQLAVTLAITMTISCEKNVKFSLALPVFSHLFFRFKLIASVAQSTFTPSLKAVAFPFVVKVPHVFEFVPQLNTC